jgi:endonuclease YncB( thermonuclease family)
MRKLVFGFASLALALWVSVGGDAQAQQTTTRLRPIPDTTPLVGPVTVLSASQITIQNKRVVLFGIDPPMMRQPCYVNDRPWDCGTAAAKTLLNMVGTDPVTCHPKALDQFNRIYAVCEVGGEDVNKALVAQGLAVALPEETKDYVPAEAEAKTAKAGMWRGTFMTPAEFREMISGTPIGR